MKNFIRRERLFLLLFGLSVVIAFWDMAIIKKVFLNGDYIQQFFPWSMEYAKAVKHFTLPFWVSNMGCGFPLVAEGQIGPFYPLNLILFFFLPPVAAYSWAVILHFMLGGVFMYIFCKKIGLKDISAVLPSILFMFASPYAGCFSNIASLKVLCWFPLILYIIHLSLEKSKPGILIFAGVVMGLQLLAGAPQMAVYSIVFSALYFIFNLFLKAGRNKIVYILTFVAGAVAALIISSPQIMATQALVALSNRSARSLSFSLARSFFPAGIMTLVFPSTMSMFEGIMYVGILPLAFAIFAIVSIRRNAQANFFITLFLVTLLCAFGRYNPLYTAMLKFTNFYLFRIPSKFLFFTAFSLIVLSGFGLQNLLSAQDGKGRKSISIIAYSILAVSACFLFLTNIFLRLWKNEIIAFIKNYFLNNVYDLALHKHSVQQYMDRVEGLYRGALNVINPSDKLIYLQLIILIASLALCILYGRRVIARRIFRNSVVAILFLDLAFFGFIGPGFRGNLMNLGDTVKDTEEMKLLKDDRSLFRVYEFQVQNEADNMLQPNMNIYFGIDNIGVYSPLIFKRYTRLLAELGCVDDSTGFAETDRGTLLKNAKLLNMLNVKYLVSRQDITGENFEYMKDVEGGKKVFLNKDVLPRAFIVHDARMIGSEDELVDFLKSDRFDPAKTVIMEREPIRPTDRTARSTGREEAVIERYSDRAIGIRTSSETDGFLVLSDYYYPGWQCYLDGNEVDILRADYILRAVYLPKGKHRVEFYYL